MRRNLKKIIETIKNYRLPGMVRRVGDMRGFGGKQTETQLETREPKPPPALSAFYMLSHLEERTAL